MFFLYKSHNWKFNSSKLLQMKMFSEFEASTEQRRSCVPEKDQGQGAVCSMWTLDGGQRFRRSLTAPESPVVIKPEGWSFGCDVFG